MSINTTDNQEIDLSQITQKMGEMRHGFNAFLFRGIQFFIQNKFIIILLLFVGVGLGYFLDSTQKSYDQQIIVTPNFKSADYLYAKIDLINSKIMEGDTLFLKNKVGFSYPKLLKEIKIEPITDVYKFIENKTENFELIKLMAEDGDIKKILEDNLTSKNYTNHEIIINSDAIVTDASVIEPLLNFLNESDYYKKVQIEELKSTQIRVQQNDAIIAQIDAVLNGFSNNVDKKQLNDKLVYYNENTQLNDVLKTKEALVVQQGVLKVDLIGMDKIIKENSATLNKKHKSLLIGKLKLLLPIVFLLVFIFGSVFMRFYNKQAKKQLIINTL